MTPKNPKPYAARTEVSEEQTRVEIERLLIRHGATGVLAGFEDNTAMVGFRIGARLVRILVPLPSIDNATFRFSEAGRMRTSEARRNAWEQARRQRFRALLLVIRAKLEAVESQISTLEQEFLAHLVLPGGQTMAEWAGPRLAKIYEQGELPPMLPRLPAEGEIGD